MHSQQQKARSFGIGPRLHTCLGGLLLKVAKAEGIMCVLTARAPAALLVKHVKFRKMSTALALGLQVSRDRGSLRFASMQLLFLSKRLGPTVDKPYLPQVLRLLLQ